MARADGRWPPYCARLLALALGLGGACWAPKSVPHAAPASPEVQLQRDVAARFAAAERMFRKGLFSEAQTAFDAVKTKFPYSPQAARSELREADILFAQARYIESAEAYRSFVRFHPRHAETAYARAQTAESMLAQVPRDWWFLPPVAEKDQEILRQTIDAYDDLLAQPHTRRQAQRAELARAQCQTQLARHELYVARFYLKRRAFAGALARAEGLLAEAQPPQVASAALALAADAAEGSGDVARSARYRAQLVRDYPRSASAKKAEGKLRQAAAAAEKEPRRERDSPPSAASD